MALIGSIGYMFLTVTPQIIGIKLRHATIKKNNKQNENRRPNDGKQINNDVRSVRARVSAISLIESKAQNQSFNKGTGRRAQCCVSGAG